MDRLKTLFKYVLWVIGFIILSEIVMSVALTANYTDIETKSEIEQINVYQAEANISNGRIRGVVTNDGNVDLSGKYIEFKLYSKRDVEIGTRYVYIPANVGKGQSEPFEIIFKADNVSYYKMNFVDEKKVENIQLLPRNILSPEVRIAKLFLVAMFI